MVSTEAVAAALGAGRYAKPLEDACIQFGITTALQKAHFLAQVAHESDGFKTAMEYASGRAYEGRADLGNVKPGDGVRFNGRGLIQLTGRENYAAFSHAMGRSDFFLREPESVAQLPYAALAAGWFWKHKGLNALADRDDVVAVTRRINGGTNGLDDRRKWLEKAKAAFMDIANGWCDPTSAPWWAAGGAFALWAVRSRCGLCVRFGASSTAGRRSAPKPTPT